MDYIAMLSAAFGSIKEELETSKFKLILESDFLSRTYYHLLLKYYAELSSSLFVDTRLKENVLAKTKANKHFDLVVGEYGTQDSKTFVQSPKLIAEFKVFPVGFSAQQLSKRRNHVKKDIDKLHKQYKIYKEACTYCICLLDDRGWLTGKNSEENMNRLNGFIKYRNKVNKKINILTVRKSDEHKYSFKSY